MLELGSSLNDCQPSEPKNDFRESSCGEILRSRCVFASSVLDVVCKNIVIFILLSRIDSDHFEALIGVLIISCVYEKHISVYLMDLLLTCVYREQG